MKPLSLDLRQRIVDAYLAGEGSQRTLAKRFHVGKNTVERLLNRFKKTGSLAPKPHGGGRQRIVKDTDRDLLVGWLDQQSDLTHEHMAKRFTQEQQRPIARSTMGLALQRLAITRKKSPWRLPSKTAPMSSRSAKTSNSGSNR